MVQRSRGIPAPEPKFKRGERPSPKARSRQMTDVTPRMVNPTAPKPKKQAPSIGGKAVLPKAKGAAPKAKNRILGGKGYTTPSLPSSASKMGKMNRKAY